MNRPIPLSAKQAERDELVGRMAADLIRLEIDVTNEREAIRALTGRYRFGDIVASADKAMRVAQAMLLAAGMAP